MILRKLLGPNGIYNLNISANNVQLSIFIYTRQSFNILKSNKRRRKFLLIRKYKLIAII